MLKSHIECYLKELRSKNLYRSLKSYNGDFVDFSSNDYLCFAHNQNSLMAGYEAAKLYGSGSTGSRLLSGNREIFEKFEYQIARDKKFESSLILNSGFIANMSVISAFSIPNTTIIFDKLNHASMYQGIDFAKVRLMRYKHRDYDELENILKKSDSYRNKIIASETVFGMDGDIADIEVLSFLSQKYGALLFLDEAHATGLYGENGCGLSTNFNLDQSLTIVMGTFSKALASLGAYVACGSQMREYLIQKSKGFIYSTALSPFCVGVAMHNWNLLRTMESVRERLIKFSDNFRRNVGNLGYNVIGSGTNIVPVVFGDINKMLRVNDKLLRNRLMASPIRPPTSPTSRIRFAINAFHREEDLNCVLEALKK